MKKLLLVLFVSCLFGITACASKITYIEIKQPTKLWMGGKPIHSAQPGDILRVVDSKTCLSGGICWWVRNDKEGYGGIVPADEMKTIHRVYKVESTESTSPRY